MAGHARSIPQCWSMPINKNQFSGIDRNVNQSISENLIFIDRHWGLICHVLRWEIDLQKDNVHYFPLCIWAWICRDIECMLLLLIKQAFTSHFKAERTHHRSQPGIPASLLPIHAICHCLSSPIEGNMVQQQWSLSALERRTCYH